MCHLALSDAGIKRFSTVIQRFPLPIYPHDQRRWHRDGWAVCPGGRFRPKLLKEMRSVAGKVFAECGDTGVGGEALLACGCIGRADVNRAS